MRRSKYNDINSWVEPKGYERAIEKQTKMIKNAYPNYNKDTDWVLWIIPDFFCDNLLTELTYKLTIIKKDDTKMDIPYRMTYPYEDKKRKQITLVKPHTNKRIHGIPLVFSSFEEIEEIKNVNIEWSYIESCNTKNGIHNFSNLVTVEVDYYLNYKKDESNPKARIFTIHSSDYPSTITFDNLHNEELELYFSQFDFGIMMDCLIKKQDDRIVIQIQEAEYFKDNFKNNFSIPNITTSLLSLSSENEEKVKKLIINNSNDVIHYYPSYCKKEETLIASEMANFVPKHIYGYVEQL